MNPENLTIEQLRSELQNIVRDYRHYPDTITPEIEKGFQEKAQPLIVELNKRMEEKWIANGGTAVSKNPIKYDFRSLIKHGI